MTIKFLGAAGTVTGSSYVLTSGSGQSILIDCGKFQGLPEIESLNYEPFAFDCTRLTGVILTHAHLDHCGRLPILLSHGFTGPIWMTPPTLDLTALSLLDSAHIAQEDNKPFLYDKSLAQQTITRFKTISYHDVIRIGDFIVKFYNAGHILGSASVEITDTKSPSPMQKIIFSGDLGNSPENLQLDTEYVDSADAVVMESTYGDRLHPKQIPSDLVQTEINEIEKSGGTLLIPAFSLERTQELLHMIMHLKTDKKIREDTPIFMDSPMGNHATTIYQNYLSLLNTHIQEDLKTHSPFMFAGQKIVSKRNESQDIYHHNGAKVIIAGSGMMTGGRILGHAAHYLPIPTTRLLIVGYQAEATLGRELLEGNKTVVIDKKTIPVRAVVHNTQAMSSHADQKQLLTWLKYIKGVKKIFLTHGDNIPRTTLAQKIKEETSITDITLPLLYDEVTF